MDITVPGLLKTYNMLNNQTFISGQNHYSHTILTCNKCIGHVENIFTMEWDTTELNSNIAVLFDDIYEEDLFNASN